MNKKKVFLKTIVLVLLIFTYIFLVKNIFANFDLYNKTESESIFYQDENTTKEKEIKNDKTYENSLSDIEKQVNFGEYVNRVNDYVKNSDSKDIINFNNLSKDLLSTNNLKYDNLLEKILGLFLSEVMITLSSGISIFIVIILMTVLKNMEISSSSSVSKVAFFACFLVVISLCVKIFLKLIASFKGTVTIITTLMQIISPFIFTTLIASGGITSVGIVQPLMLFLASFIGFAINNMIIPLLTLSVAFNVVNSITDRISLERLSKGFSKFAIWTIGVLLTIFLGALTLETSITTSIDSLAIKTTQSVVSNFVPVVGKFFSDSFETVVGATKIVGKVGGVLGIVAIVLVSLVPIIKMFSGVIVFSLLGMFSDLLGADEKIIKTMDMFKDTYKTMLGVLIGVMLLFIISIGIVINVSSSIVK